MSQRNVTTKPKTSNVVGGRPAGMSAAIKRTDKENAHYLKLYFEDRWARGIERDYTAPDLWGDGLSGKRKKRKK